MKASGTISWIIKSAFAACTIFSSTYELSHAETDWTTTCGGFVDDADYTGSGTSDIAARADKSTYG